MNIGDKVKVMPPFNCPFDDVYRIIAIVDGVYFLEGIEGGFDAVYLEAV